MTDTKSSVTEKIEPLRILSRHCSICRACFTYKNGLFHFDGYGNIIFLFDFESIISDDTGKGPFIS